MTKLIIALLNQCFFAFCLQFHLTDLIYSFCLHFQFLFMLSVFMFIQPMGSLLHEQLSCLEQ